MARKKSKCKCGCGRKRSIRNLLNETCKSRIWRAKNPARAAFNNIKYKARRRNLEFTITFEYFVDLAKESGYVEGKGKSATSLSMDRKNNLLGYIPGNMQVITVSENSAKMHIDAKRLQQEKIYIADDITKYKHPF